jgi:hypothetical protein
MEYCNQSDLLNYMILKPEKRLQEDEVVKIVA